MTVDWKGVFPAACTQFKADQSLNLPATLAHLDAMLDAGIQGLVMLGTVGENCSLERGREAGRAAGDGGPRERPRAGADGRGRVHDGAGLPVRGRRGRRPASTG